MKELYEELIIAQEEYIQMLGDELDEIVTIAFMHGWQSSRVELGENLREKIENVKNKIKENES